MPIKAVQQFAIRSAFPNYKKALETLNAVKAAGYEGIEMCGFLTRKMPFVIRALCKAAGIPMGSCGKLDWVSLLSESGLKVVSLHEDLNGILKNPEGVSQNAAKFATDTVVITGLFRFDYTNEEKVLNLCKDLNEAGKLLKERNISLLYHNHNCELSKIQGKTALQVIMENTDPDFVNFEFDSYWPTEAGADALSLMKMLGKRVKLYHIADRGFRAVGEQSSIFTSDCIELGYGNMNLTKLAEYANEIGVDAVILETHKNWINNSPVESLRLSSKFMNENF